MSLAGARMSGGERAYILGGLFHGPAQITEPGWKFSFDMDGDQGVTTRTAIRGPSPVGRHHGHLPPRGFGRVVRAEGRRYWQVVPIVLVQISPSLWC